VRVKAATIDKALIIAAGSGSRLESLHRNQPKCLLEISGESILSRIIKSLKECGIREITIVTGYEAGQIERHLEGHDYGIQMHTVFNPAWKGENGLSVLAGRGILADCSAAILAMSDHLFSKTTLEAVLTTPVPPDAAAVGVDRRIDKVFDLDDGMKVQVDFEDGMGHIRQMDKKLITYNGIDCGLFHLTPGLIDSLEAGIQTGTSNLSGGCRYLIERGRMLGIDIRTGAWLDIDTPAAFEEAKRLIGSGLL
jgi:choline kinase